MKPGMRGVDRPIRRGLSLQGRLLVWGDAILLAGGLEQVGGPQAIK